MVSRISTKSVSCRSAASIRPTLAAANSNIAAPSAKCDGIEDPQVRARCQSLRQTYIRNAQSYLSGVSVAIRQNEQGYLAIYLADTDEVDERSGSQAANTTNTTTNYLDRLGGQLETTGQGVVIRNGERTNEHVLVFGHSHPASSGPVGNFLRPGSRAQQDDEDNEHIGTNDDDKDLAEIAPLIIKTPTGAIRQFGGGCNNNPGCELQAGAPFPDHYYSRNY